MVNISNADYAALIAERDALRVALEPFADLSLPEDFTEYTEEELADTADITDAWVSRAAIRRARAALGR